MGGRGSGVGVRVGRGRISLGAFRNLWGMEISIFALLYAQLENGISETTAISTSERGEDEGVLKVIGLQDFGKIFSVECF